MPPLQPLPKALGRGFSSSYLAKDEAAYSEMDTLLLIQGREFFGRGFRDILMKMTVLLKQAMGESYDETAQNSHDFRYTGRLIF
jgi:hypothetical protein